MERNKSAKRIAIVYGSETGNAHDFASILSFKLHRLHFAHTLCSIGDYIPSDILHCRYLFIICSTTGQGELPRNAREGSKQTALTFWNFLKKKNLPQNFLCHLHVSFLGLGDSSYPKFNYAIRKLHRRIVSQLGARELFSRLEADEQCLLGSNKGTGAGIEAVYFEYEKRILNNLRQTFPTRKENGRAVDREEMPEDTYMEPETFLQLEIPNNLPSSVPTVSFEGDSSVKRGTVVQNSRITHENHFQDVRSFIFKGEKTEEYYSGDTISIYPCNSDESVNEFLELQPHWVKIADRSLKFTKGVPAELRDGGVVEPLTLRNLLKYHCDIQSIPRASFFLKIWTFATQIETLERGEEQLKQQREKLHQFATEEDMQDLFDYCNRPKRSILEVIQDFQSLKLPWEYAVDYLPVIKPRYFSISSAPCNPNIELTIAILKYKTILRKIRKGLCTDYISQLSVGDSFRYKVQNNDTLGHLARDSPMILISPGVGLAPMMSLIRSNIPNEIYLFFGNRHKDRDFLYEKILTKWSKENKIKLHACFSRDTVNSPSAKYVQDSLWNLGEEITKLVVEKEATIFLCGSSGKMPIQVRLTFVEMLKKWGNFADESHAHTYLKDMERDYRYLQETW